MALLAPHQKPSALWWKKLRWLLLISALLQASSKAWADLDMIPGELLPQPQGPATPEQNPTPPAKPTHSQPSPPQNRPPALPEPPPPASQSTTPNSPTPASSTAAPQVTLPYAGSLLKVWAQSVQGYGKQGHFSLKGEVRLEYRGFKIRCSEAKVVFHPQSWSVERINAYGPVHLEGLDPQSQQSVKGRAQEMIYNRQRNQLAFLGGVSLTRGVEQIQGARLIYHLGSGVMESQEVSGVMLPATKP